MHTFLKKLQRYIYNKTSNSKAVTRSQCDKRTQLLPATAFSSSRQGALTASRADWRACRKLSAAPRQGTWGIWGETIKRLNLSSLANLPITSLRLYFFFCEEGKIRKLERTFLSRLQLIIPPLSSSGYTRKDGTNINASLSSLFLRLLTTASFSIPLNRKCLFYNYS